MPALREGAGRPADLTPDSDESRIPHRPFQDRFPDRAVRPDDGAEPLLQCAPHPQASGLCPQTPTSVVAPPPPGTQRPACPESTPDVPGTFLSGRRAWLPTAQPSPRRRPHRPHRPCQPKPSSSGFSIPRPVLLLFFALTSTCGLFLALHRGPGGATGKQGLAQGQQPAKGVCWGGLDAPGPGAGCRARGRVQG